MRVDPDAPIGYLKVLIGAKFGVHPSTLKLEGLEDLSTVRQAGLEDGQVLTARRMRMTRERIESESMKAKSEIWSQNIEAILRSQSQSLYGKDGFSFLSPLPLLRRKSLALMLLLSASLPNFLLQTMPLPTLLYEG